MQRSNNMFGVQWVEDALDRLYEKMENTINENDNNAHVDEIIGWAE